MNSITKEEMIDTTALHALELIREGAKTDSAIREAQNLYKLSDRLMREVRKIVHNRFEITS